MKRKISLAVFSVLLALIVDRTIFPIVFHGRTISRFLPAVIMLYGMRNGRIAGLFTGWFAALMLSPLTIEPLGMAMLRFGMLGFISGYWRKTVLCGIWSMDSVAAVLLLIFQQMFSALIAFGIWGIAADFAFLPLILNTILIIAILSRQPVNTQQSGGTSHGGMGSIYQTDASN